MSIFLLIGLVVAMVGYIIIKHCFVNHGMAIGIGASLVVVLLSLVAPLALIEQSNSSQYAVGWILGMATILYSLIRIHKDKKGK